MNVKDTKRSSHLKTHGLDEDDVKYGMLFVQTRPTVSHAYYRGTNMTMQSSAQRMSRT
jgi:hypothetical protein